MTKMVEIIEIIDEGMGEFCVEYGVSESVETYINSKRLSEEDEEFEGNWYCVEKNGWVVFGYEGSEFWGMCKIVEEGDKEKFEGMDNDEIFEFVEGFELSDMELLGE